MKLKVILHIFLLLCFLNSYSQSCKEFHKSSRCAVKNSSDFKEYSLSRGATVEVGKIYSFSVILYGKRDFIINACSKAKFNNVHYRIINKLTKELIYDNEEDNYQNAAAFSVENTITVDIELEVLYDKQEGVDPQKYRVCAGVQILSRKIPKLGF